MQDILDKHVYVGFASIGTLLIQYRTHLLMVNATGWIKTWLYQISLHNYGHYDLYRLQPPLDVLNNMVSTHVLEEKDSGKAVIEAFLYILYY